MDDTGTTPLSEAKSEYALGLPRDVMAEAGSAAQTYAAFRMFARNTGETFSSLTLIADRAVLPVRTVKDHIAKLIALKLMKRKGRQRRRTQTYCIKLWHLGANEKAKFAILPRWAAAMLPTWGERAIFALIVSRDCLNQVICGEPGYEDLDLYGRMHYPAKTLANDCGLSLRAIGIAKQRLADRGLIK